MLPCVSLPYNKNIDKIVKKIWIDQYCEEYIQETSNYMHDDLDLAIECCLAIQEDFGQMLDSLEN